MIRQHLWYTDSSVDFWLSQRIKKAKAYICIVMLVLYYDMYSFTGGITHG